LHDSLEHRSSFYTERTAAACVTAASAIRHVSPRYSRRCTSLANGDEPSLLHRRAAAILVWAPSVNHRVSARRGAEFSRRYVVKAGKIPECSAEQNADLFWGLRGAGANLGVATQIEYRLHPQKYDPADLFRQNSNIKPD